MGTRADFYIGRGENAEWIGSIGLDGYPEGIDKPVLGATTDQEFRAAILEFFTGRDDVSIPEHGWPWPWEDSRTTDYTYALDGGKVWASCFGTEWFDPTVEQPDSEDEQPTVAVFPNMKVRQSVTFGRRSGLMVIGLGGPVELP